VKRFALAIAACLSMACATSVPVRAVSELPRAEVSALLADAGDILGLQLEETSRASGSITLDIHESPGAYRGRNLIRQGCRRASWASPDAEVIAHEIAHALGLDHVDDRHNLMAPSGSGLDLTSEQHATMEREAWRLSACP
jgi:hypothetical protein